MTLKIYVIEDYGDTVLTDLMNQELRQAKQVTMKLGYPNGKDGDSCLIVYALYESGVLSI